MWNVRLSIDSFANARLGSTYVKDARFAALGVDRRLAHCRCQLGSFDKLSNKVFISSLYVGSLPFKI